MGQADTRREGDCVGCAQLRAEGPDPVAFAVTPASGGGWYEWAGALVRLFYRIGQNPTQAVVIHQQSVTGRYVQLLIGHGIAHAEASSNVYLAGDSRLAATHEELLAEIGWSPPGKSADDPDELPANWSLPLVDGDWNSLAEVVVATIAGVFGFDEDVPVEIQTFMVDAPCRDCFPRVAA